MQSTTLWVNQGCGARCLTSLRCVKDLGEAVHVAPVKAMLYIEVFEMSFDSAPQVIHCRPAAHSSLIQSSAHQATEKVWLDVDLLDYRIGMGMSG